MPFLQYADNRNLREQIYKAYIDRGSQDNAYNNWANISKMVSLRVQKARLLGFPDYASYVLDDNMAKIRRTYIDYVIEFGKRHYRSPGKKPGNYRK